MQDLSRRLACSNVVDFPRRCIGFHLTIENLPTRLDTLFIAKTHDWSRPVGLLSTARRQGNDLEVWIGRPSGCAPSQEITSLSVSSYGLDLPKSVEFSLWAEPCQGWGKVQVEFYWTYR